MSNSENIETNDSIYMSRKWDIKNFSVSLDAAGFYTPPDGQRRGIWDFKSGDYSLVGSIHIAEMGEVIVHAKPNSRLVVFMEGYRSDNL